jgi:uncharacterized protein with NAD-binding domain and iron-sulfur cluster
VIAEKRATITCSPGAKAMPAPIEGVAFAGDYTDPEYPPTLEAAVRSGIRAAAAGRAHSLGTGSDLAKGAERA